MNNPEKKRGGWSWWYLLFVIQFAVALWPPLYNKAEPYSVRNSILLLVPAVSG